MIRVVTDHKQFLWTLKHHSPSQPITRIGLTVQHIIQCQSTSTVIWLYNLLPYVSPWGHFLLRPQRKTNALHTHGPQYNDHHGICKRVMYSHSTVSTASSQIPFESSLNTFKLPVIQLVTWCPNQHLRNNFPVVPSTSDFIKSIGSLKIHCGEHCRMQLPFLQNQNQE